jgi:hypothetical protein
MAKSFWSRRAILRGFGVVSLGTLAIFSALTIASANPPNVQPQEHSKQKGAVGSWSLVVKFPNGSQQRSLGAFTSDGITIITNEGNKATGYGVWKSTGTNTFTYRFREPIYDTNGNLFGEVYVVQEAVLNSERDRFDSEGEGTVSDFNGNVIAVETTTVQATRIK